MSSFVGVFPMHAPRYAVLAIVDEPKGNKESFGYATGGWVSAPAVGKIIAEMGPILGLSPVDDQSAAVREAVDIELRPRGKDNHASY
jgi:cell division protein FtsI (penicillin-binding protein 3)